MRRGFQIAAALIAGLAVALGGLTAHRPAAAIGQGWSCPGWGALRYKAAVPRGDLAGVAGGYPAPLVAAVAYDATALTIWLEGADEPARLPYDHLAGWQYTGGTSVAFTPLAMRAFADDLDGDGGGDALKLAALHDRGHNFDHPDRIEPLADLYILDTGCRLAGGGR